MGLPRMLKSPKVSDRFGDLDHSDLVEAIARDQGIQLPHAYDPAFDNPVDEKPAAGIVGLSPRTLQQMRREGTGPPYLQLTPGPRGKIGYAPRALIVWRQLRIRRSTAEASMIRQRE